MMKNFLQAAMLVVAVSSPIHTQAISSFSVGSGVLYMPRIAVDGTTYFDNVSLYLDFATGTFSLLNATPTTPPQPDQVIETQNTENFTLDFQGCFRDGQDQVSCYLRITNNDFDRDICVNATKFEVSTSAPISHLYDDLSNEYNAIKISIANTVFNSGDRGCATLVRGVPATGVFTFEKVSPSASSLTLFKPGFSLAPPPYNVIKFNGDFRNFEGSFF
jgi:hypothetical protein